MKILTAGKIGLQQPFSWNQTLVLVTRDMKKQDMQLSYLTSRDEVLKFYFSQPDSTTQMLNKETVLCPKQVILQMVRENSQITEKDRIYKEY